MWLSTVGLIITLALSFLVVPGATDAQQPVKLIGLLEIGSAPSEARRQQSPFQQKLRELGWVEGQNLVIESRYAEGKFERFPALAAELVRLPADVIVVWSTMGAVAVQKATRSIPVVFLSVGVPVEIGLVSSLAHPGGNMTGVTFEAAVETYGKRLELLKEAVPTLSRVAVLYAVGDPNSTHAIQAVETAAPVLGLQIQWVGVHNPDELDTAFATITSGGGQGVIVVAGAFTMTNRRRIADLTLQHRLPSAHAFRETVVAGGLMSLGPNLAEMARKGAVYVDKILKGARPGDLPVEQPMHLDFVLNLKTAQALGLTISPYLLILANEVIK